MLIGFQVVLVVWYLALVYYRGTSFLEFLQLIIVVFIIEICGILNEAEICRCEEKKK